MNPKVCQKEGEMETTMIRQYGGQARFCSLFVLLLPLLISLEPLGSAQNMVNAPVDTANRVSLKDHHPAWASAQNDQGAVPADLKLEALTIVLNRPPRVEAAYTQFLAEQQNPNSPNYHRWLTPVETGQRFGASAHDIAAVTGWLQAQGLSVDSVSNSKVRITFSGTAAQVANAFGGEMHYFQVGSEKRISMTGDPQIPAALKPVVRAVSGLSTVRAYPQHQVKVMRAPMSDTGDRPTPNLSFSGENFIAPADFATIYNLTGITGGFNGSGQSIAIIGRSRVCAADITNFASVTAVTISQPSVIVPPGGIDPGPAACTSGASLDQSEATLDVTRSGSIAQGSSIVLVISADSGTVDGIATAATYVVDTSPVPAHVMSISFGLCESAAPSEAMKYDSLFQQGAGEGISVFVSSGDSGAAGCDSAFTTPPAMPTAASPNLICSSGWGTCVGGTEFNDTSNPSLYWGTTNNTTLGSALSYIPEGAWNEPMNGSAFEVAGTGGGVSQVVATPSWQVGTGVPSARSGRYTPDVAFSAALHDGYFGCLAAGNGSCVASTSGLPFVIFAGTSAAAPDMAGIAAVLNQSQGSAQGQLNPRLYALAQAGLSVFNDVTVNSSGVSGCTVTSASMCNNTVPSSTALTGGTQGFLVGAGYDEATGLGSLNVANLLANWAPVGTTPSQTTVQSSALTIPVNNSVTFTITVAPTSGTGTPTGKVTIFDGASNLGSFILSNGTATYSTSGFSAGVHPITAAYSGDPTFAKSTSAAVNQAVVNVMVTENSSSLAVSSGSSGTLTFTVTPTPGTGFAPSVQMTCTVAPALAGCALNPASFTANGATNSTLTITAVKPGTTQRMVLPGMFLLLGSFLPLGGFVMLRRSRGGARWAGLGLIVTLSMFTLWLAGCGGGSNNNTPKGSYTVTVSTTATSGAITINPSPVTIQLTVQ